MAGIDVFSILSALKTSPEARRKVTVQVVQSTIYIYNVTIVYVRSMSPRDLVEL
jgi:hypothetical protein